MYSPEIYKSRFDKIVALCERSKASIHPEEAKIRLEQAIAPGKGQYIFSLVDAKGVDNLVTFDLKRNDVFVPFAWCFKLGLKHKTTGVERLYTFAPKNDGVNPSAYPVGFANDQIDALFAGHIQWMLDTTALYSRYPMEKFLKVPETQPCFILKSDDTPVQQSIELERQFDKDLELLMPKLILAGTRDHKITVNFDTAGQTSQNVLAGTNASDYEAHIVLMMDGVLVKNGCENGNDSVFGDAIGNW